jgi:hypothetical protein
MTSVRRTLRTLQMQYKVRAFVSGGRIPGATMTA